MVKSLTTDQRGATGTRVLVVGATGSIGRHVVAESLRAGHETRGLVRDLSRAAKQLPGAAELVAGEGTDPSTLTDDDLEPLFTALKADREDAYDGVLDPDTLPLANEPAEVMAEIDAAVRD